MKCFLVIYIFVCSFAIHRTMSDGLIKNPELTNYLQIQSEAIHDAFTEKNHLLHRRSKSNVEIDDIGYIIYPGNYSTAKIFPFFETTRLVMDNAVYFIETNDETFSISNFNDKLVNKGSIIFIKAVQYKQLNILLTTRESETNIYVVGNRSIDSIQSISTPYARDAEFFMNNEHLYLIIINNKGDNLAETSIYKWLGTHFDEIDTIFTTGAVKTYSFSTTTSEIIIILQNLPNKENVSSIYEFSFEKIKKIQHLRTADLAHVDSYIFRNKIHVIVFGKSKNNTIYTWSGSSLVKISQFETYSAIQKSEVLQINESSIVIASLKDRVQVFRPSLKGLRLVDEKRYPSNYSVILDVYKRENKEGSITFIVGLSEDNIININVMSFKIHFTETETHQSKNIRECFDYLEMKVYNKRKSLNDRFSQVKSASSASREDFSKSILSDTEQEPDGISKIRARLDDMQSSLQDYQDTDEHDIVINGRVVIKGSIEAEKLTAEDVYIKKLNDKTWTPEQWLMYREAQTVTGPVTITNIVATNLETATDLAFFNDLLLKNGDQQIFGSVTIENLTTNEIFVQKVNGVALEDIYLIQEPQLITGLKTFRSLQTREAQIKLLNGLPPDNLLSVFTGPVSSDAVFDNNVEVENLIVEYINDVHWDTFKDSVFRIGETTEINGNLTFPEIKTEKLTLSTLNGVEIENLLTTSTNQIIDSDITFNHIFAENITLNTVNNIKLADSAVHFDDNSTIQGPVKFDELNVRKDLELVGKLNKEFFLRNGDHIIGTNESDLLQTYNGKIKIHGNLYVKNITLEADAELIISENQVDPNVKSLYWTKSTDQQIPVHFEAQNGLTAPHLLTDTLNNIKISQYMLNNNENKFETSFHFENVSIAGDVLLNSAANHQPDLNKINMEAVKTNGSFIINGKKTYSDTLRVENLAISVLDGIVVFDTLTTHWTGNITGKKIFKNVIIQGNLTSDMQSLEFVNGVDIKQLLDSTIYIDQPQDIRKLHFKNITVLDLYVTNLNNRPLNEYISNLETLYSTEIINNLIINGNVTVAAVQNLSAINDIGFESLLNNTLKVDASGTILGDLQFLGNVKIENLVTSYMNDMYLPELTTRFLLRNDDQTITAPYSFTNVKAANIVASKINRISIESPLDVSSDLPQTIYAPNGIEFSSAKLLKSLRANGTSPCDLEMALKGISDPPSKDWHRIEIQNDVVFMDTDSTLFRVFEQAVTKNSENIIHAPVNFSNHILAENVISSKYINDVNIEEVINDAVLIDSEVEQVITGHKIFPTLNVLEAKVRKNTDSPVVNRVDIPKLVEVMVNKNDGQGVTVRGTKTFFGGLECNKFYSKKVANVDPENLVNLQNPRIIASAVFEFLEVENDLNISYVNRINFNRILQDRLLTTGPDVQNITGIYYFDDVEIENMKTPSINNIKLDNVVFDTEQQNITSPKHFMRKVEIFGNAKIDYINGVNITHEYGNSVMIGKGANIDGTITFLRPAIVNGSINADYINGYAVDDVKGILHKGTTKVEAQKIHGAKNRIIDIVKRNLQHVQVMATDYMYIEKSDTLQISVANTISANIITSKDQVLIHVTGEESGEYCGLPDTCKCPVQYSVKISPEHSVATLPNKGPQRAFSYGDDSIIIYFLTNSVSTDSNCRTERARVINEVSMMTWNTLSTSNTTGRFYQYDKFITGYISGAEFFSLNGKSYAIIGIYYDSIKDTHDLDCIVIKFNEDKSKAEEIQKIPTKGAWSIYLFHAAQGVTLIIGNVKSTYIHHEDEETRIYTFNEIEQQFDILRIVPSYGASITTGVVLGADSLIVLAHKSAPLQILKYSHYFGNYYFYQSLELEAPVIGMSVFYTGAFGISDAYLCIVTGNDNYFIYSFQFIEGWKLESSGELEGLRNLIPFELNKQPYLFAPSTKNSSLLTVVKHGSV